MKRLLSIACACLWSPCAFAGDLMPDLSQVTTTIARPGTAILWSEVPLIASSNQGNEVFRLEPGGCLRGPLRIRAEDGSELFRLEAGATYPHNCMEK